MKALDEAGAKARQMPAKEAGDLFVKQAKENLRKAAEEAERKYPRLPSGFYLTASRRPSVTDEHARAVEGEEHRAQ